MKRPIIILICTLSLSCTNELTVPVSNQLIGEWRWEKSYGGFNGNQLLTPENTGIKRIVFFKSKDSVDVFENGSLIHRTDYFIRYEESILNNKVFEILTVNYKYKIMNSDEIVTVPVRYMIEKVKDTLVLNEDVFDGYSHLYRRPAL